MKKITAVLGNTHNDFERQVKDLLNEMSDVIDTISAGQINILEYQNKLFLRQHAETLQSPICDLCQQKANFLTTNIEDGTYKSYCNDCLSKTKQ